jgi:hypothetical protein
MMPRLYTLTKLLAGISVLALCACAKTQQAPLAQVQAVPLSGMLTDMDQLQPGGPDQASLRYVNPSVDWKSYTKIIIEPVTFWGGSTADTSTATQQMLCDYLYNALNEKLASNLQIVTVPGPNTMVLKIALTDVTASTPGLRTISVVVPQARLLTALGNVATGNQAFAGSAQGEGELTDSVTGERLAAFVDRTQGGASITNADSFRWGDVKTVMDSWVALIQKRFTQLQSQS